MNGEPEKNVRDQEHPEQEFSKQNYEASAFRIVGMIDGDLVAGATDRPLRRRTNAISAAVIIAVIIVFAAMNIVVISFMHGRNANRAVIHGTTMKTTLPPYVDPNKPIIELPPLTKGPDAIKFEPSGNLWDSEGFAVYSAVNSGISVENSAEEDTEDRISVYTVSIPGPENVKIEAVLSKRYVTLLDESGNTVYYDLEKQAPVDLSERVIPMLSRPKKRLTLDEIIEYAAGVAEESVPGLLSTEKNKEIFRKFAVGGDGFMIPTVAEAEKVEIDLPDVDGMPLFSSLAEDQIKSRFIQLSYDAYKAAAAKYRNNAFKAEALLTDPQHGLVILQLKTYDGANYKIGIYDFVSDRVKLMQNPWPAELKWDRLQFGFSQDGLSIWLWQPEASMYLISDNYPAVYSYKGEKVYYINLNSSIVNALESRAAGECLCSPGGNVIYFKLIPYELRSPSFSRDFMCRDEIWQNRLAPIDKNSDTWQFRINSKQYTFDGIFVKFIREEKAVVMLHNGEYCIYSLLTGNDLTEYSRIGQLTLKDGDQYVVYFEDGKLFRRNIFTDDEPETIGQADFCTLIGDRNTAVMYTKGEKTATLLNTVSLEKATVTLDIALYSALEGNDELELNVKYRAADNILVLSCQTRSENDDSAITVDFFDAIKDIPYGWDIEEWLKERDKTPEND